MAHDAMGDVIVLEKLFEQLFNMMFKAVPDEKKVLEEMLEVSAKPIMIKTVNFGKHKGEKVIDVAQNDPQYLEWLLNQKIQVRDQGGINDEDWIFTLEQCLEAYCR